jgi:hypothetical protein
MPTLTTILMAAGTAYQAINALSEQAKAKTALDQAALNAANISNKQTNLLTSLKVPTRGTDLAQQNIQANQAGIIQTLKKGGAATVLGGLTKASELAREEDLQLAAKADEMQYTRDLAVKQQDQAIADAKLNRAYDLEMSRMQGAQVASAAAQSTLNQSIGSASQFMGDMDAMKIYKGQDPTKITDIFKAKVS